jgi:hypothetical protein
MSSACCLAPSFLQAAKKDPTAKMDVFLADLGH